MYTDQPGHGGFLETHVAKVRCCRQYLDSRRRSVLTNFAHPGDASLDITFDCAVALFSVRVTQNQLHPMHKRAVGGEFHVVVGRLRQRQLELPITPRTAYLKLCERKVLS